MCGLREVMEVSRVITLRGFRNASCPVCFSVISLTCRLSSPDGSGLRTLRVVWPRHGVAEGFATSVSDSAVWVMGLGMCHFGGQLFPASSERRRRKGRLRLWHWPDWIWERDFCIEKR